MTKPTNADYIYYSLGSAGATTIYKMTLIKEIADTQDPTCKLDLYNVFMKCQ